MELETFIDLKPESSWPKAFITRVLAADANGIIRDGAQWMPVNCGMTQLSQFYNS